MTGKKITPEAESRLDAMVRTTNGFEIAELDLQQRGPGEFFGTRQAGLPDFRVANLLRDRELLELAKREAALVAGGEGGGLRALVHRTCDFTASIPMAAGVESLNVGVAVAIALYELTARRSSS